MGEEVRRRVLYSVAMSLDGYIAGPGGEYDWIPEEDEIDWGAFMGRFDTMLVGRGTWETLQGQKEGAGAFGGMRILVFSTTLDPEEHPELEIVGRADAEEVVEALRREDGKDIWLMGGGDLFRSLLGLGLVDAVEVAVIPVLLGGGIPLLPSGEGRVTLELVGSRTYPGGIVLLEYRVEAVEGGGEGE